MSVLNTMTSYKHRTLARRRADLPVSNNELVVTVGADASMTTEASLWGQNL